MGQYYMVYTEDRDGNKKVYDRSVDGKYTIMKLMEHSWHENPFMMIITNMLYKNPTKVAWVGDYADEMDIYELVWGEERKTYGVSGTGMLLDGKYLVNHSKKLYVDFDKYKEKSGADGRLIHPLSLLTACGNGRGGGDYFGSNLELVGTWAMDFISVEDEMPCAEYYKVLDLSFTE